MFFGKRRHFFGVVSDKSRLDKVTFALLTKYLINQFSFAHRIINFYTNGLSKSPEFGFTFSCDIKSCEPFNSFGHSYTRIRGFEIYFVLTKSGFGGTIHCLGAVLQEIFGEFHHPVIVLIRHVDLHSSKFWVVRSVHPLVAEVFGKFIHAVKASHNETLKIEFVSYTHIERNVQCIVMSNKRTCRSPPRDCLKYRRFYLYVPVIIEVLSHSIE